MEIPREKLRLEDGAVLSPLLLAQPYACATVVNVTGYVAGADIAVQIDGATVVSGFAGGSPAPFGAIIPTPGPLVAGQIVAARQSVGGLDGPWSVPVMVRDHSVDYPAGPPRPEIFPLPLYDCGVRTGVGNLLVGSDVRVEADASTVGSVSGANNPQGINIGPAFNTGQRVRAWADLCHDPSPPSLEQVVLPDPGPLPAPGFDPIYEGGQVLVVTGIADGGRFTVSRNSVVIGTFACWGGRFLLNLNPPFAAGERFDATQELCASDGPSPPGNGTVQPCSALPAPQLAPVQNGDTQVIVTDFVPGSEIRVFVNGVKRGDGSGPVVTLTTPVPHRATIDVWQILGACEGRTVQEVTAGCFVPHDSGDPSGLNLFPVGTYDYDGGQVTIDGFTYGVRGSIYYPADDDGANKPFNTRLASLGRVPVVVCVHGAHDPGVPSYLGYDYFQYALARMGFVAVSVDERQTDESSDWAGWTQNIVRRAELALASIAHLQQLDAAGPIFDGKLDLARTGLMGHSRGGDCVIAAAERLTLGGVSIRAVLSLAPVNSGANSGRPSGYAFMTFLPAADGDVVDNNGAQFYDAAHPDPVKTQLYIDHANHNYFNRQWLNDDTSGGLPIMARPDHERILLAYGCAFFRFALRGDGTFGYLDHSLLPSGVQNPNIHIATEIVDTRTIDDYEAHPITIDTEGQPTAQIGGLIAADFPFAQATGAFNGSFFGASTGNVSRPGEIVGSFREPLRDPADLRSAEIRVRAAEVFQAPNIPTAATGFRVGAEDRAGTIAWIDVDDVGGLPRPFDRRSFDWTTKTMLSTFRFGGHCFADENAKLQIDAITAIHLGLNRGDERPIAFDDLEIVQI
jgi:alpha-beta hydrolase superfamily lysophospholipase